jgi:cytochrome c
VSCMNRTLGLACFLALSSMGVGIFQANAEASDANQPAAEKSTSSDEGSNQKPGTNNEAAEKPAASGSASSSTISHTRSTSRTAQPVNDTPDTSGTSVGGNRQDKAFYVITSDVVGRKVRGPSRRGEFIGRLSGFIIDSANGETPYVVIDRGGFLGVGKTHIVVPFQLIDFSGQWGFPILAVDETKLDDGPEILDQDVEALLHDPNWRRSVDAYYGLVPRTHSATTAAAPSKPAKATTAESPNSAGLAHGEKIAHTVCAVCHTFKKGGSTLVGPNLYGVVGRPIASVAGYNYSSALKKQHGSWAVSNLEDWLRSPNSFAPGTFMTFKGLSSEKDRQDVVDYLKTLGDQAAAKH